MDLGLGNLTELKRHLLNEGLRHATTHDTVIAELGRGVAARFEAYCDRKFARTVGATFEFSGDREHVIVDRYPVESISAVALRETLATGWVDQGAVNTLVDQIMSESGVVLLAAPLGCWRDRGRLTYTGGFWYATSAPVVIESGTVAFASGGAASAVTFSNPFASVPAVKCSVSVPDGGAVIDAEPYAVTVDGFTLRLGAPAPASGYSVTWVAVLGGDDADASVIQEGSTTLAANDESKAVAFGTAFAAAPVVVCNLVAPEGGVIVSLVVTAPTTTGFTALFGAPIPAAGYKLAWLAVAATAATSEQSLPTGATARPADLYQAWLLQCEHVWRQRDVLGLSLAADKAGVSPELLGLSRLELVPEVAAVLRRYVRHSLS